MAGGVLAFDLSPSWCGWSYIEGATFLADSFNLGGVSSDLGAMGRQLTGQVRTLKDRFAPSRISYEAPILKPHDKLATLRCTYGVGMVLETLSAGWGIPCNEVDLRQIKSLTTGDQWAEKKHVAAAIESLGVRLPLKAEGREDAGDAAGCALVTLQRLNPEEADVWLAKIKGWLV
jgi:Holliday junction resolvasome RuvABC endonuclease subunit